MMKFFCYLLLGLAVVALLPVVACCKSGQNATDKPSSVATKSQPVIAAGDSVRVIYYKRYRLDGEDAWKTVYRLSRKYDGSIGFYSQQDLIGEDYINVPAEAEMRRLVAAVEDLRFGDYPLRSLDNVKEGKTAFWAVEIVYDSGARINVVEEGENREIADRLLPIFGAVSDIVKRDDVRCARTRFTYKRDGSPSRTISYDEEGVVIGGHDYDRPDLDF